MATPSEYLLPILRDIERTVLELKEEYKTLNDKEVERCYLKLKDYYRKKSFDKPCEEPESHATKEQDLMDELLNTLEEREEEALDDFLLNSPNYSNGGNTFLNVYQLYAVCFNHLSKSVKRWRKDKSRPSYLGFIAEHVL